MERNVPLFKIYWDDQDINRVTEVIKSGMNWATGPNIQEFEKLLAEYVGMKYAVTFNSGTSALHAIMLAYDIGKGDEVIVPAFTFIATANCALFTGAKPVFAEIEDKTYGLDPADVERKITSKTRAIMPVHFGGCSCRIAELRQIADKHKILLIEDAAESLGSTYDGKKAGSFGEASIFSFCAPKVITTGEGGVVVTDSKDIFEKLKLVRSHGRLDTKDYFATSEYLEYVTLGYNFRMSNITAALGIAQLAKIEKNIKMRRENAAYLTEKLSGIADLALPLPPDIFYHIYQMYTIRIKGAKGRRDALMNSLNQKGIGAKVYYHPIHLTQFYREKYGYKVGDLPATEDIAQRVLTLPMYPTLTKDDMDYIAKSIESAL
ncbi:MAG: DegT/DnrJ/EryC1/StrS family aminotransferase [Dehalococcoidales bacterium]